MRVLTWLALGAGLLAWGCGDDARPEKLSFDPCYPNCDKDGGGAGMGGGGGGGGCMPDPRVGTSLIGDIGVYAGDEFSLLEYLDGTAEAKGVGSPCGIATAVYDSLPDDGGRPAFVLQALSPIDINWVTFSPQTVAEPLMPTALAVNTTANVEAFGVIGITRVSTMEQIALGAGVQLDPNKGHAIVQILDPMSTTQGFSGAKLTISSAEAIGYRDFGWGRNDGGTGQSGVAALLNMTADPFPGRPTQVGIDYGAGTQQFTVAIQAGTVTVFRIQIRFGGGP